MEGMIAQHIEATPGVRGGRPRIVGTRLTVADIATLHLRMGWSIEQIAGKYEVSLADVHAAMAYYYDHRAEIDEDIARDRAYAEAARVSHRSLLKERLESASGS